MRRSTALVLSLVLLFVFGFAFLWPLGRIVQRGFFDDTGNFTLRYLGEVFRNPIYRDGLINSLKIAVGTTCIVTLIAVPLAWLSNKYSFFGKGIFSGLLLVPMILPPFVGAIGFQQIFGEYGSLNALLHVQVDWLGRAQYWGVVVLQAFGLYPILYLNVAASLANIDPAMEQAAQNLGSTGWQRFRRITLPLIMPGMFAGGTIVFIWSFHRTRHAADHAVHPLHARAGVRRPQRHRHQPVPVRPRVRDARRPALLLYILGKFVFGRSRRTRCRARPRAHSGFEKASGWRAVVIPLAFLWPLSRHGPRCRTPA